VCVCVGVFAWVCVRACVCVTNCMFDALDATSSNHPTLTHTYVCVCIRLSGFVWVSVCGCVRVAD